VYALDPEVDVAALASDAADLAPPPSPNSQAGTSRPFIDPHTGGGQAGL
jgi:hypothetical protein